MAEVFHLAFTTNSGAHSVNHTEKITIICHLWSLQCVVLSKLLLIKIKTLLRRKTVPCSRQPALLLGLSRHRNGDAGVS